MYGSALFIPAKTKSEAIGELASPKMSPYVVVEPYPARCGMPLPFQDEADNREKIRAYFAWLAKLYGRPRVYLGGYGIYASRERAEQEFGELAADLLLGRLNEMAIHTYIVVDFGDNYWVVLDEAGSFAWQGFATPEDMEWMIAIQNNEGHYGNTAMAEVCTPVGKSDEEFAVDVTYSKYHELKQDLSEHNTMLQNCNNRNSSAIIWNGGTVPRLAFKPGSLTWGLGKANRRR
jgi:hypothetical protein